MVVPGMTRKAASSITGVRPSQAMITFHVKHLGSMHRHHPSLSADSLIVQPESWTLGTPHDRVGLATKPWHRIQVGDHNRLFCWKVGFIARKYLTTATTAKQLDPYAQCTSGADNNRQPVRKADCCTLSRGESNTDESPAKRQGPALGTPEILARFTPYHRRRQTNFRCLDHVTVYPLCFVARNPSESASLCMCRQDSG